MIQKDLAHRIIDEFFETRETLKEILIPKEANQHFLKAKKEGLLGIQVLVSHLIKEMDTPQQKQPNKEPQAKKVIIDE